ncbi:hypothetical protein A3709_18780 [Halioglobus sp. HI00S01]|uniref:hypothetical protein n=1 Tax=Halioglobus sp. HI00S01 TaxID=1822214 RepID=UPI0007C25B4E|nr:hypothetical protein [Halioglobus sp. HI00S01]KZX57670.1 hypothetical protein A3709_18780 [Halioglobus sp. HI00S01]
MEYFVTVSLRYEDPRVVLREVFPSLQGDLPVNGMTVVGTTRGDLVQKQVLMMEAVDLLLAKRQISEEAHALLSAMLRDSYVSNVSTSGKDFMHGVMAELL